MSFNSITNTIQTLFLHSFSSPSTNFQLVWAMTEGDRLDSFGCLMAVPRFRASWMYFCQQKGFSLKTSDREIPPAYYWALITCSGHYRETEVSVKTIVLTNLNTYHVHSHRFETGLEGLREPVVVKKPQELQLRKQALYMLRVCENESEMEVDKRGVQKCEKRWGEQTESVVKIKQKLMQK